MADTKPTEIILGSGYVYAVECTSSKEIPEDATFETDANLIGLIQGGATFTYTPTYYTAKDDMEIATKTVLTAEEAHLKGNLITVQGNDPFSKLCSTAQVSESQSKKTIKIGGISNYSGKTYVVRFVHQDGKHRITLIGVNQAEISISYTKDKETVIAFDYLAQSMDDTGVKAIYEDTTSVAAAANTAANEGG